MAAGADATGSPGAVAVREYRDGDERGILDLFRRVFGVERALAHWRWKYLANPAGREIVVAVDRDGRIVGQFASLPNRGLVDGRQRLLSQLLDHMVDDAVRRHGVYAAMARAFHERFLTPEPTASYFGFNLAEVHAVQVRTFGFELLHGVSSFRLDLATGGAAPPAAGGAGDASGRARAGVPGLLRVDRVDRFPAAADRLWERSQARYRASIARDARYLNWRYADCPDVPYALLLARHRLTRAVAGLAVVRLGWPHEPIAALVDWVIPEGSAQVWTRLAAAAHALGREAGLPVARVWLPPSSPDRAPLLALGYEPEASPFLVSAWNDGHPDRPLATLRDGWHYTMGDSDIF